MEYLRIILNNALYLSFLVIIISSVIGVFIAGRKRDLCLKDFHGFECRLNLNNGKTIYGVLRAFGSGIEIEYTQEHHDTQGHTESSFILYSAESAQIDSIKRFHHDLSHENQSERSREIRSTYHPNLIRIIRRKFRNFLNTFQDGLKKSLTMFVGAAASRNPKSQISTKKKELSGLGTQMIGAGSYSFDSILEQYI
ncbi:hypothetical protein K8T06_16070 [bacterium]|nr:hypothetical protein [bacterium]